MAHCSEPLLGAARPGWNELENLVRYECSVRTILGCRIDDIAISESDLCRYDNRYGDICRHGDRLRAVLILNHQSGAAAFLYRAVRHA